MNIALRRSRRKAVSITIAGFVIGMVGSLLLYADDASSGWLLVITAVFTLIYGFGTMGDRRPRIVLDEYGLTELFTVREQIEWEAIRQVNDFWFRGQNRVCLLLDRNYKMEQIQPMHFRRFDRIYESQGLKAIFIDTLGLEIGAHELAVLLERMRTSAPERRTELLRQFAQSDKWS